MRKPYVPKSPLIRAGIPLGNCTVTMIELGLVLRAETKESRLRRIRERKRMREPWVYEHKPKSFTPHTITLRSGPGGNAA